MKTVYFDIDTQLDFMVPSGSLYVPGAEQIVGEVARLNRKAAVDGSLVISTMDAHSEDDPEFKLWPRHCVLGALGQRKVSATLLDGAVTIPNSPDLADWRGAPQLLLEKQTVDCFTNPNLTVILREWNAATYVVYGVVTEICVRNAVVGLLPFGKPIHVVRSAIQHLEKEKASAFLSSVSVI